MPYCESVLTSNYCTISTEMGEYYGVLTSKITLLHGVAYLPTC